jgi:glycosyltransferase involved in cell wall biosynthesis
MSTARPRVLLARGHHATPWNLRPWEELTGDYDVAVLLTGSNAYDLERTALPRVQVGALRDRLPRGRIGDVIAGAAGDRYLGVDEHLAGADIVHAEELSFWFSGELARLKPRFGYRLVLTVWETLPFLDAFRNRHARTYRQQTLAAADAYLAATERARDALLLEGVPGERIEVCHPGVDLERFSAAAAPETPPAEHLILSPGRLEWEKGHHDVMRALAALRRGLVTAPEAARRARLLIVGSGPEERRLRAHADELGIADAVEFRSVPYAEMPAMYARASCMVLASLSSAGCQLYLGDVPRCFWEEQFGMVLAEAMAARLAIAASSSGAIPEVTGDSAQHFLPGDWMGLARLLADGPLARAPGTRVAHPRERVVRYSTGAAAQRLAAAYERLLAA